LTGLFYFLLDFRKKTLEEKKLTIKNWAVEDRPREKLLTKGKSSLTNAELIAILIGSGSSNQSAVELSREILASHQNDLHRIAQLEVVDLKKFKGIGEAKAITIVSALELGRRRKETEIEKKPKVVSSKQAYDLMEADLHDQLHEEFWIILLKRNGELICKEIISRGGVSGTMVDSKIIFKKALDTLASGMILVHNHPSGNLTPSQADISLTKKLKEAGEVLDIKVMDHIIYTNADYFSFSDQGLL